MFLLSLIEWHCKIAEYSYANHDDHPHLHKQEELDSSSTGAKVRL